MCLLISINIINATHLQYQIIGINFALDETIRFVFNSAWDDAYQCTQVIVARLHKRSSLQQCCLLCAST